MTATLDTSGETTFVSLENDADWCAAWAASAPLTEGVLTPFGVLDPDAISPSACVDMLIALDRLRNWLDAQQVRYLARLARRPGALPLPAGAGRREVAEAEVVARGFLREEIALAITTAPAVVQQRMDTAVTLAERLPETLAAMESGAVPYGHAAALADAVEPLDADTTAKIQTRVLARAGQQNRGLFLGSLRRALAKFDPRGAAERHARKASDRKVEFRPEPDAMATITAYLTAAGAMLVRTAVQSVADTIRHDDTHHRTADQLRADALVAICSAVLRGDVVGGLPREQGHAPAINVSVALSTLLHLDDQPGDLAGYGPIPAEVARDLAADPTGTWRRLVTDHHGTLLDYGRNTYRPPAALRDHIVARDRTERFPGSTRAARKSEIDHIHAWIDEGETNEANLHLLSKRSQTLKHDAGWHVERLTDGTTHWTSSQGRHYHQPAETYPIDTTASATGA